MKFVSILVLLGLMACTWKSYKDDSGVTTLTHFQLQNDLKNFIADYIASNLPGASNLVFHSFYTEPTLSAQVRAVFEYSFIAPAEGGEEAKTALKGYAYLSPQGEGSWTLDRVEVNNQILEFKNGTLITPDAQ